MSGARTAGHVTAAHDARASRRELGLAVAVGLAGAVLAWVAAGRVWATVRPRPGAVGVTTVHLTGGALAGGLSALAVAGLAGALALLAARSWPRLLLGVLLVGLGAGVVALAVQGTGAAALHAALRAHDTTPAETAAAQRVPWPWAAVVGGVLVAGAGALVVARGRRWPALGGRYDAPGARRRAVDPTVAAWEALDRGEDPTTPAEGADPAAGSGTAGSEAPAPLYPGGAPPPPRGDPA